MMKSWRSLMGLMMMSCMLLSSQPSLANTKTYRVKVEDAQGAPLSNAVVWLTMKKLEGISGSIAYKMQQKDKAFLPHVLVVPKGVKVEFPNLDPILHHVYSFSEPKSFELKLYRDEPKSVHFPNTGVVELGCNIHDWMLGYIVVVDSHVFALTDQQGIASLQVPMPLNDTTSVYIWHDRFTDLTQPELMKVSGWQSSQLPAYRVKQTLMAPFEEMGDEFNGY